MNSKTMKQYVIDAFTDHVFAGNPAAVCNMDAWLPEDTMMAITRENNLSETAFAVQEGDKYHLRWFTPGGEIDLCGHATLATACAIMTYIRPELMEVTFTTLSGDLTVVRRGELYEMDFPAYELKPVAVTQAMVDAMDGAAPKAAFMGRDLLCVFEDEAVVRNMAVDQEKVRGLDGLLLHVTAPGRGENDCVSRSFAPKCNVPEDPVCGSGHCHIIPYWTKALGRNSLTAYQASRRGGTLYCTQEDYRIKMSGKAAVYAESVLHLPE